MSAGRKDDTGKPDYSLVPKVAMTRMAEAFNVGAKKYGRYNFCKGLEASRIMGALLRHSYSWYDGEEFDPDGQHHLGSVLACAAMLLRCQELGTLIDDRYLPPVLNKSGDADGAQLGGDWAVVARGRNGSVTELATYPTVGMAALALPNWVQEWPTFAIYIAKALPVEDPDEHTKPA